MLKLIIWTNGWMTINLSIDLKLCWNCSESTSKCSFSSQKTEFEEFDRTQSSTTDFAKPLKLICFFHWCRNSCLWGSVGQNLPSDSILPVNSTKAPHGSFLSHGGSPYHHPFSGIFHEINHPAMWVPPWSPMTSQATAGGAGPRRRDWSATIGGNEWGFNQQEWWVYMNLSVINSSTGNFINGKSNDMSLL